MTPRAQGDVTGEVLQQHCKVGCKVTARQHAIQAICKAPSITLTSGHGRCSLYNTVDELLICLAFAHGLAPPKRPLRGLESSCGASGKASLAAEAASCAACFGCSGVAALMAEMASLAASLGCSGMLAASGAASLLPPAFGRHDFPVIPRRVNNPF